MKSIMFSQAEHAFVYIHHMCGRNVKCPISEGYFLLPVLLRRQKINLKHHLDKAIPSHHGGKQ